MTATAVVVEVVPDPANPGWHRVCINFPGEPLWLAMSDVLGTGKMFFSLGERDVLIESWRLETAEAHAAELRRRLGGAA